MIARDSVSKFEAIPASKTTNTAQPCPWSITTATKNTFKAFSNHLELSLSWPVLKLQKQEKKAVF